MNEHDKAQYLAKVIILAQSEDYHVEVIELINKAERNNAFKKVSAPDLTDVKVKQELADADVTINNPIENSSSHQNY